MSFGCLDLVAGFVVFRRVFGGACCCCAVICFWVGVLIFWFAGWVSFCGWYNTDVCCGGFRGGTVGFSDFMISDDTWWWVLVLGCLLQCDWFAGRWWVLVLFASLELLVCWV